jgi:hypothetical protein
MKFCLGSEVQQQADLETGATQVVAELAFRAGRQRIAGLDFDENAPVDE